MNKILFLSLALFVAETVSAEEGLQPYLIFGNSGQTIEDTNESITLSEPESSLSKTLQGCSQDSGNYHGIPDPSFTLPGIDNRQETNAVSVMFVYKFFQDEEF